MKLTKAIEAAKHGLAELERRVAIQEEDVRRRGKELNALRSERDAHGEMLNAMMKRQACMPEDETIEFRIP